MTDTAESESMTVTDTNAAAVAFWAGGHAATYRRGPRVQVPGDHGEWFEAEPGDRVDRIRDGVFAVIKPA